MGPLLRKADAETAGPDEAPEPAPEETPDATGEQAEAPDGPDGTDATGPVRPRWRRWAPAALAAILVLAGGGFFYGAHQLRTTPSAENRALTDTEATTQVGGEVSGGLARIFSYAPGGTAATERSARTVLAGKAARQYEDLFDQVRESLAEQRLTLTTQAVRTGVVELTGDRARLLVFLDQTSHRAKGAPATAAAQLTVTARLTDGRWRITDLTTR
ncbi:nuclear transport factor 2 family protein [Streptomyces albidoflavus]|uniref:nuclear transport factor 2 family protein n=1 Tax=Streptomyces albidoflavus TaxID=1886 RepID=UPI00188A0B9E|nr:nuclear transport factor 2 family protein [Streptomyces albidoflavus]MBF4133417.1 nuclear transport factor 2 family protein [Streptomyces albidoflavus]